MAAAAAAAAVSTKSILGPLWKVRPPADHVIFQNEDVCILKPDSAYGVPVLHFSDSPGICNYGLFSYNEYRRIHPELRLRRLNRFHIDNDTFNSIYFRAPWSYSEDGSLEGFFEGRNISDLISKDYYESVSIIKVDPFMTSIYFSEARIIGSYHNLIRSRRLLIDYLDSLRNFKDIVPFIGYKKPQVYNGNRHWEIVVKVPHMDISMFRCFENNKPVAESTAMNERKLREGEENEPEEPVDEILNNLIRRLKELFPGQPVKVANYKDDVIFVIPNSESETPFFVFDKETKKIRQTNIRDKGLLNTIFRIVNDIYPGNNNAEEEEEEEEEEENNLMKGMSYGERLAIIMSKPKSKNKYEKIYKPYYKKKIIKFNSNNESNFNNELNGGRRKTRKAKMRRRRTRKN